MATRNLSQEAHLWYTISSPDYIAKAKIKLQEAADLMRADVAQHAFIADYAPVPYWGGVIEDLLDRFDGALEILKQGEFDPMQRWASRMKTIPRGLQEGNMNWMSEMGQFMDLLNETFGICDEFLTSVAMSERFSDPNYKDGSADWRYELPEDVGYEGNGIARYIEPSVFPVLPHQIPEYAPDTSVSCKTGDVVPWTGVWVPNTGMGTAALAFARQNVQIMQPTYEIASVDDDGYASFNLVDCIWHPVKPTGRMIEHPVLAQLKHGAATAKGRCESGERCPREGLWFTPAAPDKRHFKLGEVMPSVGGDYGVTIWQWAGE
ncbi:MAG: hypothetical protein HY836_08455 [Aquabacterium sp.]|uniref:hypothetical protein n=1 Tax=Aquabacterium sp. TaxID=1872578 RepID=UPI0025B96F85|nr:hypothetical protein [Aquabacterium sp.]MBI5925620.1 hypothetical protein [Aquabacterium sp.]